MWLSRTRAFEERLLTYLCKYQLQRHSPRITMSSSSKSLLINVWWIEVRVGSGLLEYSVVVAKLGPLETHYNVLHEY